LLSVNNVKENVLRNFQKEFFVNVDVAKQSIRIQTTLFNCQLLHRRTALSKCQLLHRRTALSNSQPLHRPVHLPEEFLHSEDADRLNELCSHVKCKIPSSFLHHLDAIFHQHITLSGDANRDEQSPNIIHVFLSLDALIQSQITLSPSDT